MVQPQPSRGSKSGGDGSTTRIQPRCPEPYRGQDPAKGIGSGPGHREPAGLRNGSGHRQASCLAILGLTRNPGVHPEGCHCWTPSRGGKPGAWPARKGQPSGPVSGPVPPCGAPIPLGGLPYPPPLPPACGLGVAVWSALGVRSTGGARGGCNPPQFIGGIHGPPCKPLGFGITMMM